MDRLRRIFAETDGSEIAEAALVIPIFFLVLLGIYWFGRAFNTYATINHAAREGALAATMLTCASCGNAATAPATVANAVDDSITSCQTRSQSDPGLCSRTRFLPRRPAMQFG